MKKLPILLCCLILAASCAFAQEREQSGMIKTAKGVLVVWNEPGNYYTVEIKGNKIIPAEQPLLFQVDGKFFQIQTAEKKAFLKNPNDKSLDDKTILAAHRDWEGDYISGIIHSKLKIDSVWLKLANNTDVLAWSYDMPKVMSGPSSAKRQLYLAVVKRDHIFLLNSAVTGNDDEKEIQKLLLDTINTMRSSDKPLSLKAASEQILRGN